jgi:hypothetical protein
MILSTQARTKLQYCACRSPGQAPLLNQRIKEDAAMHAPVDARMNAHRSEQQKKKIHDWNRGTAVRMVLATRKLTHVPRRRTGWRAPRPNGEQFTASENEKVES